MFGTISKWIDNTINPSQETVNTYKRNIQTFILRYEVGRRTIIDIFFRDVVSLFPNLVISLEHQLSVTNQAKRRKLTGQCDYTISHRGLENLPHLIAVEAKVTDGVTMGQVRGECAAIHYQRRINGNANLNVYGIHTTGVSWIFFHIDQDGQIFQSRSYPLNIYQYVEEEFNQIYRLVYYMVEKAHRSSPTSTPVRT